MTTERRSTCVIIRATSPDGQTTYYGPFLPHVGAAATSMLRDLSAEVEDEYGWEFVVENVFIGPDESDCAVLSTR